MNNPLNIAYIFAWSSDEKWSTPISIVEEAKSRGIGGRIYSLYNKDKQYTADGLIALYKHFQEGYKPDIILHMDYGVFDHPLLDKQYFPGAFMVMEAGDDPQSFNGNFNKAYKFDLVLTPDIVSLEKYKAAGIESIYWTHFADVIHGHANENIIPAYDVVSTRGDGDTPFLDALKERIGPRFCNKRDFNVLQRDLLSNGKIVIQNSRYKEVSRRIFEGMLCGRMVMTDRLPVERGLGKLFKDKVDIVYYDDLDHAVQLIDYYISHEDERMRIADAGWNNVLTNHTTVERLDAILNKFYEKKVHY